MKKLFAAAFVVLALSACNSEKDQEKALLNDVIKIHDEVMGKEDKLMQNKMKLDTLLSTDSLAVKDPIAEKIIMSAYSAKLVKADGAMEAWMQKFNPDQKGKSHEQIMAYLAGQKKEVLAVDSQLTLAVKGSDEYLSKFKK
jgi:hypothetical protein